MLNRIDNSFRLLAGRVRRGAGVLAALAVLAAPVSAQLLEDTPAALEGVGIEDRPNAALPLQLTFRDEAGQEVALGSFFASGKPVIVNLVYFNCPMLCNVFLDGFTSTLSGMDWTPGDQFEVVTVSIDPADDAAGATAKRAHYLEELGRPEAETGWHFLTGSDEQIHALADAVGFTYHWDEKKAQFMHSAGLFVATPEGRLSRTLYGVAFEPQTLRLSLVEASDGKVGSAVDRMILFCYAYDHTEGRYGPAAMKLMRAFGAVTVVVLGALLATFWRTERRRRNSVSLGART
jgi:protein SCO1/2